MAVVAALVKTAGANDEQSPPVSTGFFWILSRLLCKFHPNHGTGCRREGNRFRLNNHKQAYKACRSKVRMCKPTALVAGLPVAHTKFARRGLDPLSCSGASFYSFIPGHPGVFVFVLAALLVCSTNAARAALLAYEGFNYPAGTGLTNASDASAGDSFGWAWRWAGANVPLATNISGSLGYTDPQGNSLATDGGSVIIGNLAGSTINAQPSRSLAIGTLGGSTYSGLPAGTYWVSFTMQWVGYPSSMSTSNLYWRKGDIVFRSGALTNANSTGTELVAVGRPSANQFPFTPIDTWTLWSGGDSGAAGSGVATTNPLTSASLILMRLDVDGNGATPDTAYLWVNWTNLTIEPPIATANATNSLVNLTGLNNLRLDANNQSASGTNTVIRFDEFRFGTAFADVTPLASVPQPPSITSQPANQTVTVGDTATFNVSVTGDLPYNYQWYFNTNTLLTEQTNALLTITNVQTTNAGGYAVVVGNNNGSVTSLVATLNVLLPVIPSITAQPQDWTNAVGFAANFAVGASGSPPLHYQWYFNSNTLLTNQTNASLSFIIASTNDAGGYSVMVTNNFGSVTSRVAILTVIPGSPPFLPAFPGADGAGKFATGGRGGIVYHVKLLDKNFNDVRPGTLRFGLNDANFPVGVPRTIVFDVAGVFWLGLYGAESNYDNGWNAGQSRYDFPGNATLAGQTAPGPVIIMGGSVHCNSANTIVRNITFAPGYGMQGFHSPPTPPTPGTFPDSYVYDAVDVQNQNIILDHLTALYATDEAISCNEMANNFTVENCDISQGQNYPQADAESSGLNYTGHALAHLLQAGSNAKISVLNNLYAHEKGRLPRVGTEAGVLTIPGVGAINDFRNNVFYDWFDTAGTGSSGQPSSDNFINNFYLAGPGGDNPVGGTNYALVFKAGGTGIFNGSDTTLTTVYRSGNFKDTNKDGVPQFGTSGDGDYINLAAQSTAYDVNIGVTLNTPDAFTNVLRYVGSRWWDRAYDFTLGNTNDITTNNIASYIDERLIHETVTGTGKIMAWADDPFNNDPNEGVEWRSLLALRADPVTGAAPYSRAANWDTDGDGMPDWWEIEHGLNSNVPDNNGDYDHSGFNNLEKYLNEIAAWPAPGPVIFTGAHNNRYAEIFNWQVNGVVLNINGTNVTTASLWLPSRFDTAVINNATVTVDSVGQHAGILCLTNNAELDITNGWLKIDNALNIGTGCTVAVSSATLEVDNNLVNNGTLRLTGTAALTAVGGFTNNGLLDIMTWTGTLPPGFVNNGTVLDRSAIQITSTAVNGPDVQVAIQGYTGHSYQLQYRDSLSNGTWQNVGVSVAGANAPIVLTHTGGATAQQRFYRVAVN
jgi:hypothetical protein